MPIYELTKISNTIYEEKEKIFKYTMLIQQTKKQVINTTLDIYMDVIRNYKNKIKELEEGIAYLEKIACLEKIASLEKIVYLEGIIHLDI